MPFQPAIVTSQQRRALRPNAGLCADCYQLQILSTKRSSFVRCGKSDEDDRFPRYPPLPVHACPGYRPAETAGLRSDEAEPEDSAPDPAPTAT